MDWSDLVVGLGLFLVFEGILPFANPGGWKNAIDAIRNLDDQQLRIAGAVSMIIGMLLVFFAR